MKTLFYNLREKNNYYCYNLDVLQYHAILCAIHMEVVMKHSLAMVFLCVAFGAAVHALVLPDKTQVDDSLVQKRTVEDTMSGGRTIIYFFSPVEIPSILGKIAVTQVAYNKDTTIAYVIMGNGQKVIIGATTLIPHMISFDTIDDRYTVKYCHLQQKAAIATKVGTLLADEKDTIYFNSDRSIRYVQIFSMMSRELQMKESTVKVTGTLVVDDMITTPKPGISLTLTEPGTIATPFGLLLCKNAYYSPGGVFKSCELASPQTIVTKLGDLSVLSFSVDEQNNLQYCVLSTPQKIQTPWGLRTLQRQLDVRADGTIRNAYFYGVEELVVPFGKVFARNNLGVYDDYITIQLEGVQRIITPIGEVNAVYNITLSSDMKLIGCQPKDPVELQTAYGPVTHRAEKYLQFNKNGAVIGFHPNTPIQCRTPSGILNIGTDSIAVKLYDSGKIQECYLSKPLRAKNAAGTFVCSMETSLYENGSVSGTMLAEPAYLKTPLGIIHAYDRVEFATNGLVRFAMLKSPAVIAGKRFPARTPIEFDEHGKLKHGPVEGH